MKAEHRKLPSGPFTGGLAPNRFQKTLGMRRDTLKSNLS
jgi:hypothetical protein